MRFRGFTVDEIRSDAAAQLTIRAVIAAILGVSIDQVTLTFPSAVITSVNNQVLASDAAYISAIIRYILEEKGYSPLDTSDAFAALSKELMTAAQNGRLMAMIRKESEQTYNTDFFSSNDADLDSIEVVVVVEEQKEPFFVKYKVEVIISASALGAVLVVIAALFYWQRRKKLNEEADKKKKLDEASARAAEAASNSYDREIDFSKDDFSIKILSSTSRESKPEISLKHAQERDSILSALYGRPSSSKVHVTADELSPEVKDPSSGVFFDSFKADEHTIYVTSHDTHDNEPMDESSEFFHFDEGRADAWDSPVDLGKAFNSFSPPGKTSWALGRFADRIDAAASPEADNISHLSASDTDNISVSSRRLVLPPIASTARINQSDLRIDPFTPHSTFGSINNDGQDDILSNDSPVAIRIRNRARRSGGPKSKKSSPQSKRSSEQLAELGAANFSRPLARPSRALPPVQIARNRIAVQDVEPDIEIGVVKYDNDDSSIDMIV